MFSRAGCRGRFRCDSCSRINRYQTQGFPDRQAAQASGQWWPEPGATPRSDSRLRGQSHGWGNNHRTMGRRVAHGNNLLDRRADRCTLLRCRIGRDAVARGSVLPVYIDDYDSENPWSASAAYRWWTHYSLESLQKSLAAMGSRLIIRKGTALKVLKSLITETGANAVVWNRGYEPAGIVRDTAIKEALRSQGVEAISHKGALLLEPH